MHGPEPDPEDIPTITVAGPDGEPSAQIVLRDDLPDKLFVFPLRQPVPFPNMMMPVLLDSEQSRRIVAKAEAGNGHLLLVAQRDPQLDSPGADDLFEVGVAARILKTLRQPDGNSVALCQVLQRARIDRYVRKKPNLIARVKALLDVPAKGKRAEATYRKLRDTLLRIIRLQDEGEQAEQKETAVLNLDQPEQLADFAGAYFVDDHEERQRVLETTDLGDRVRMALESVLAQLELAELGKRIEEEIRAKAQEAQKQYFLREQLKVIRRELGEETDAREAELERLQKAVAEVGMPEQARERADEELTRLRTTPVESGEYSVLRNYLDWLTGLPWSRSTTDNRDLARARAVLDEDHYGLDEVKERILEFLAVRKLKPEHAGSILCLSGPPGVGKTSLGRSIARAMGREFWRFSLGGMRDEAEIKGHRRTYIGAMPGRILQGLKACGSNNPVLMLDEIDKLGTDYRGDPSSALLEVLDPEQNSGFLDHYLDVQFDLSRVMFIATANALPEIPEPLRDRMEVIELAGYLVQEKVEIAARHLLPRQLDRHGLKRSQLDIGKPTLRRLISLYTREAGVRGLEKCLGRLCRKTASAVASRRKPPGRLKADELEKYLGLPRWGGDGERRIRVPGVVQGLSWTPHGGDVLFVEVAATPGKGQLVLTGSLGEVMSESVRLAMTYLRSNAARFDLDSEFIAKHDFHVHFPAGAIPKDGPSAGIAIATAVVSLLVGKQCPADLAMTGELTLVGEVLPIGGVREKVLAARHHGLKRVVLPSENRRDVDELAPELVKGVRFVYVDEFSEVFAEVFGTAKRPRRRAR